MMNLKSQKGSVTLFVLIAVLFFSVILLGMYNSNMNKLQTQDKDIVRIKQSYEVDANKVYEQTVNEMEK